MGNNLVIKFRHYFCKKKVQSTLIKKLFFVFTLTNVQKSLVNPAGFGAPKLEPLVLHFQNVLHVCKPRNGTLRTARTVRLSRTATHTAHLSFSINKTLFGISPYFLWINNLKLGRDVRWHWLQPPTTFKAKWIN